MKVMLINSVYAYGSTGRINEAIEKACNNKGIETRSIYGRKRISGSSAIWINSFAGFLYDILKSLIFANHGLNSQRNTKKILNQVELFKPDIVYIGNLHGFYINYEMLFKYLEQNRIKVVITLHDCWLFTGFCAG